MAEQPQVMREFPGGWLECRDSQGIFYYNSTTQQSSEEPPRELQAMMQKAYAQSQQMQSPAPQQPQAAARPKVLRQLPGGWVQLQDDQGIFYHNTATNQSYDDVPAELKTLLQSASAAAAPPQY